MKTLSFRILLLCLFLIKPFISHASHAMGGEITYECHGANQYTIKMALLRDCSGINLGSSLPIVITNSCGFANPVLSLSQVGIGQELGNACFPGQISTCNGGTSFGIQLYRYEGTVTLPGDCQDWTFSHTVINRNSNTTTLGSSNDSMYIYSVINNTNSICSNSPRFGNIATGIYYLAYPVCYDHSAYDIDGDSLGFQLITPRTGPSPADTVDYISGYSVFNPIQSSPPLSFESTTGALCFTSTLLENTVFAVLVSEFRNGVLIGQVERDIELRTSPDPVPNSAPVLSGINGGFTHNYSACPGTQIDFFITAFDSNATEDLTMYWNVGIPAATWVSNTAAVSNSDTGYFSWTPTLSDVSAVPYCFKVTVHDNHCPRTAIDTQQYCIHVLPPTDPFCLNSGISEEQDESAFQLFPNPAHDEIRLIAEAENLRNVSCSFYNSMGQEIFREEFSAATKKVLDVSSWPRGIYAVVIRNDDKKSFRRIILQ